MSNRRARCHTLTAAGRKQLASERREFDRLIVAIQKVLGRADCLFAESMRTLLRRLRYAIAHRRLERRS